MNILDWQLWQGGFPADHAGKLCNIPETGTAPNIEAGGILAAYCSVYM